MAFASARGNKSLENDKGIKEAIESPGRFGNFRSRNGDADAERFRDGRTNTALRRRDGGEQESEGWSTVKPRKSFGHEGAERFHGRMGGNFRDERRQPREREDRETPQTRTLRPFDPFSREKDNEDPEARPRNGLGRNKSEPWFKNEPPETHAPEKRERIDKAKSWRDREHKEPEPVDDRNATRTHGGRWGRDQRVEREPEWLDEPLEEQPEAHTQQDFQKWMEEMKKAKNSSSSATSKPTTIEAAEAIIEATKPPVQSAPVESGPDKFFMAFGSNAGLDNATTPGEQKETASRAKPAGKSSRFTSFFSQPQEEARVKTEPVTPMVGPPMGSGQPLGPLGPLGGMSNVGNMGNMGHMGGMSSMPGLSGLGGLGGLGGMGGMPPHPMHPGQAPAPEEERQAFAQLLMKLQKQSMTATPPGPSPFAVPPQGTPDAAKKNAIASPESPFQQYGGDRRMDGPMGRPPPQHAPEILSPRPQPQARPDQLLQDLVGHHQRVSSQGTGRPDNARNNSNAEFLMNLMRAGPPPDQVRNEPRNDQFMMRMQQPQKQPQMPPMNEREPDYGRDNRGPPQRQMRPQPPPGFPMDDSFHGQEPDGRSNQPTQILQRPPPPPGLDQMPPNWMPGGQMPPPQGRGPMIPPPGLAGGLSRNIPMPHMFPPNFPPGAMPPPPEAMGGMPPRNMPPPPPPGFFGGPPHGFMPPGLGPGFNGPPGPEHGFPGLPFENRGMPPSGNAGRGAAFGRQ